MNCRPCTGLTRVHSIMSTNQLGTVFANAQGMQLTNTTNVQNPYDYGHHGKLQLVEIDSGITKDQIKTGFVPN